MGVGCRMGAGGLWVGACLYCDDLLLMAPNRQAMVLMLRECEKFAEESNITFSTDPNPQKSKSKLIFMCGSKSNMSKPEQISLCGSPLPWVASASHLGHTLHESGLMDSDIQEKKAQFISQSLNVRETFKFASPVEVLGALNTYCSAYYGCLAGWDLSGELANQFYNCWKTNVKLAWAVPRATRTYLVQQVLTCGYTSARTDILARFVKFFQSLLVAPSHEVRTVALMVAWDLRTTTAKNLDLVRQETNMDPWTVKSPVIKRELKLKELVVVDSEDEWRVAYLTKLLEHRQELYYNSIEFHDIDALLQSLCIN